MVVGVSHASSLLCVPGTVLHRIPGVSRSVDVTAKNTDKLLPGFWDRNARMCDFVGGGVFVGRVMEANVHMGTFCSQ